MTVNPEDSQFSDLPKITHEQVTGKPKPDDDNGDDTEQDTQQGQAPEQQSKPPEAAKQAEPAKTEAPATPKQDPQP